VERGAGFKIVATKGSTASPDSDSVALVVRKDLVDSGRVRSLSDLRGLTVTTAGLRSATEISLFTGLAHGGITPDQVTYVPMGLGDMPAAFANHSIDAAMASEPYMSVMEEQATAVRFMGNSELMG